MELSKCSLLIVFLVNYVSTALSSEGHEKHEDPFHDIVTTITSNDTVDTLQLSDVNSILMKLGVHDCSNVTQYKHKCVKAETLFKIVNISTSLKVGEEDFSKFAPIILYALLPKEEHSNEHTGSNVHNHDHDDHDDEKHDSSREITQNVDVYKELLERYATSGLCNQILDQLLKEVNDSTGERLHGDKCFSSHVILDELNVSSDADVGKSSLSKISLIIISRLIQKQCIQVKYKSPLPCTSYFLNKLFQEYAKDDVISEEKLKELLKKLKIGRDEDSHEEEGNSHDHGHAHARRRRSLSVDLKNPLVSQILGKPLGLQKRYRREAVHHEHGNETKKYQKCYSVGELFTIYQVNKTVGFKLQQFQHLSSALLQQIESNICAAKPHKDHSDSVADKHKWGYGILAVAIISLCSVTGVAIIPFLEKIFYQKIVVFLISLAVGTLVGDALLHLLPHALGFHSGDGHDHGSGSTHESEDRDYLWKFLVATAAVYGFFLFETLTHLFLRKPIGHSHTVEHTRRHSQFGEHNRDHGTTREVAVDSLHHDGSMPPVSLTNMGYVADSKSGKPRSGNNPTTATTNKQKDIAYGNGFSETNIKEKTEVKKTISSVAWNIIIGDTIHNIADGIAIGVAFSNSVSVGVSTAIAVFCHEFPHELGDFAVLLAAGMSVKKALLANFLSACSCFIGLVCGILISEIGDANLWIFAATAGFFIYIALTNMLPELIHSVEFNKISKAFMFFLQNLGILTGFAIMFLLSYYEEDINI